MASSNGNGDDGPTIESRRSKHTTKFDRLSESEPQLYGKRPHLAKSGREIANAAAEEIQRENPDWVDPTDVKLTDVLKWLDRDAPVAEEQAATLSDLLAQGMTFQEAVTWYLYEYGGLTLREIYHVDEGMDKSFSKAQDRQAERNVAATLQSAAEKLGLDVDVDL